MKIQFEDNLDYQADAVRAVIDLFRGQPQPERCSPQFAIKSYASLSGIRNDSGIRNHLLLSDDKILENLQSVQKKNGLPADEEFKERKFTIEMETGTGKTYVYLRTIFELHKNFGFSKFIIIVPSIAIKEGVYKTLQITRAHFERLYPESAKECNYFLYDSKKLNRIRNFAAANTIQIMLTTIGALNRQDINSIYKENEKTGGEKPIDLLRATSPVIIVDEPQSVEGGINGRGREAISKIGALCMLYYSATHRDSYNKIYQLNAVDAHDRKLVKKIEVASLGTKNDLNKPYIYLKNIWTKPFRCRIEAIFIKNGEPKKSTYGWQNNENLEKGTNNSTYSGYTLLEITKKYIKFSYPGGEKKLNVSEEFNGVNTNIRHHAMIKRTIKEHLDKELRFASQKLPIKVLSLFFIDRVENYRVYEDGDVIKGEYAKVFEREYKAMAQLPEYGKLFDNVVINAAQAHNGYFSMDKKNIWQNTEENTEDNRENAGRAYNLIMKDKEKLLSFDCPLKFIFSHSALKEGWDNPNVFQICALREMISEQQKRQTIGRGMRLCVSQNGERVRDSNINRLTVVAAENYKEYAAKLQSEIERETGIRFGFVDRHSFSSINIVAEGDEKELLGDEKSKQISDFLRQEGYINIDGSVTDSLRKLLANNELLLPTKFENLKAEIINVLQKIIRGFEIKNADERVTIKIRKNILESEEFKSLWERIKDKTTYRVKFDSATLIADCIEELDNMASTFAPKFVFRKAGLSIGASGITIDEESVGEFFAIGEGDIQLPDLLGELQNHTKLTRRSLIEIICGAKEGINDFLRNPMQFIEIVTKIINNNKQKLIVGGICYRRIGDESYSQELFENKELTTYLKNTLEAQKSVYERVVYESESVEKRFAKDLENNESIKVYAKLPRWFVIQTPLGTYNPDWAVLAGGGGGKEKLYLVAETKSKKLISNLRFIEEQKIECGRKHFGIVGQDKQNPARFIVTDSLEDVLAQEK